EQRVETISDDTKVYLFTPYKLGKFNLSHRYVINPMKHFQCTKHIYAETLMQVTLKNINASYWIMKKIRT
ncbi:hypothetical protein GIB67_005350, partial [Kingdonia uniflora]